MIGPSFSDLLPRSVAKKPAAAAEEIHFKTLFREEIKDKLVIKELPKRSHKSPLKLSIKINPDYKKPAIKKPIAIPVTERPLLKKVTPIKPPHSGIFCISNHPNILFLDFLKQYVVSGFHVQNIPLCSVEKRILQTFQDPLAFNRKGQTCWPNSTIEQTSHFR